MGKNQNEYGKRLRLKAMMTINPFLTCECCGSDFYHSYIQIDHIKPIEGKRVHPLKIYKWIIENNGEGFQLLCANCNMSKRNYAKCTLIH